MSSEKAPEKSVRVSISRRDFLKFSGMVVVGACFLGYETDALGQQTATWGFLLVDPRKCQGCQSCMLACSLVHHSQINPSLSRIQIQQDPYGKYPDDIAIVQCRQCTVPTCVPACPTGALARDPDNGNVATVDTEKCIGCKSCIAACSFAPARTIWNADENHAQKCDLCAATPHWNESGGPDGKKACVETCPLGAITFTKVVPDQTGADSYTVNLRDWGWKKLGYPIL